MARVTRDGITYNAARNAPSLPSDVGDGVHAIVGLQPFRHAYKNSRMRTPSNGNRASLGSENEEKPTPPKTRILRHRESRRTHTQHRQRSSLSGPGDSQSLQWRITWSDGCRPDDRHLDRYLSRRLGPEEVLESERLAGNAEPDRENQRPGRNAAGDGRGGDTRRPVDKRNCTRCQGENLCQRLAQLRRSGSGSRPDHRGPGLRAGDAPVVDQPGSGRNLPGKRRRRGDNREPEVLDTLGRRCQRFRVDRRRRLKP